MGDLWREGGRKVGVRMLTSLSGVVKQERDTEKASTLADSLQTHPTNLIIVCAQTEGLFTGIPDLRLYSMCTSVPQFTHQRMTECLHTAGRLRETWN